MKTLREMLRPLSRPVDVWPFVEDGPLGQELLQVLDELQVASGGRVVVQSPQAADALEEVLGVDIRPALHFSVGGDFAPIEMVGAPTGYQFGAMVGLLTALTQGRSGLTHTLAAKVKNVTSDVMLEVAVAPTVPFCPQMVRLSQDCALANPARIFARSWDVTQGGAPVVPGQPLPTLSVSVNGIVRVQSVGVMPARDLVQLIVDIAKGGGEIGRRDNHR